MQGKMITVFGGSGFIGRYAVRALCRDGWRVRVAVRNPMNAGDMRLSGEVGQVQIVQANVRNRPSVARAIEGADAVLNLVGILFQRGRQTFSGSQALGAANVAELSAEAGVKQLVQMSAIGADIDSKSAYARTKAEGEAAAREHFPDTVILRPSVVFGSEDGFFNRFANLARFLPVMPNIGGGKTKVQPIFVGDVADAIVAALAKPDAAGRTYELGGPQTYTWSEILNYVCEQTNRPRMLVPLPFFFAEPFGMLTDFLFKMWPFHAPPLTGDQVRLMKLDNVVGASSEDVGTLSDLGVAQLETVEAITPTYLWPYRPYGQFQIQDTGEDVSRVDL